MKNKQDILVSIVMSEYNTPIKWLEESIESILHQTYRNFEFIIINDCSKNDVEEIIKKYNDSRIKVINNEKNIGLANSLNKGISIAKGKYIARMDTDDIAYSNRLEEEIKFLEENNEYFLVASKADIFNEKGIYANTKKSGKIEKKDLMRDVPFVHPSVMYKKEVVLKLGCYPNLTRCEDYALWCNAYLEGYEGYIINKTLLKYRVLEESYKKRTLKTRKDAIKVRYNYCKKNNAKIIGIIGILKIIIAGIIPQRIMYRYHRKKFKN